MQMIETTARSVEEAIEIALKELDWYRTGYFDPSRGEMLHNPVRYQSRPSRRERTAGTGERRSDSKLWT